jgi:hypothetical protein
MLWCSRLVSSLLFLAFAGLLNANDADLWKEYGLVRTETAHRGEQTVTSHQLKDLTGAVAAFEWQRSPDAKTCQLASFCSQDAKQTTISEANYVVKFEGRAPTQAEVDETLKALPDKHATSLPAILSFLPKEGRLPNSARYILGPSSLKAFAPELASSNPGFSEGAEAQVATYQIKGGSPVRLALFYYPTPEMARMHTIGFRQAVGMHVKRSAVLVAAVFGAATDEQADTVLSRVQYEAKITWNDLPPPSPMKPLYRLLVDILYISTLLSVLCLAAGLVYASIRFYRRRYGTLESDEAMTTLNLTGTGR